MDPKLLADALTIFLAPAMPFLVSGGEETVRRAGRKIGKDALNLAKRLWQSLGPKAETDPAVKGAAEKVAAAPENADAHAALSLQLCRILEADPEMAAELARIVDAAGPKATYQVAVYGSRVVVAQGPGAVAAGGIAVSGSVNGSLHVGGDRLRTDRESSTDDE